MEYEYNQENLRTAKIESDSIPASAKTVYGYDKDGNLVLEKNAYNASDKTVYLWEDTGNAAIMKRGGKAYSYVYDGMGRIHALHDYDAAENTFTYDVYGYTAYGEPLYTVGNVENPFRYASYYYDTDTGLYYLKNRYYVANKARFLTEDTYWNVSNMMYGKFTDAVEKRVYYPAIVQSANRYMYGMYDPLKYVDKTGTVVHVCEFAVSAGVGAFVSLKIALVWDDVGNVGIQPTFSVGGGIGGAIGGDFYEFSNLESIDDLNNGASLSTGGGIGPFGLSQEIAGGDVTVGGSISGSANIFLPSELNIGYYSVYNFSRAYKIGEYK